MNNAGLFTQINVSFLWINKIKQYPEWVEKQSELVVAAAGQNERATHRMAAQDVHPYRTMCAGIN